ELMIEFVLHGASVVAIKDDGLSSVLIHKAVTIAGIESSTEVVIEIPEPAQHVAPGQHDGYRNGTVGSIFCMPAIYGHWITRLTIVVGKNRRKLLQHHMGGELLEAILIPGLGIESIVITCPRRIVPFPAA